MKRVGKIIFGFLLSFLASNTILSQEPILRQYDITKGLPSNECYRIIQDKKGYIWIASDEGVSRYNGYSFQNFTKKDGLPDNVILHLFEDYKGRIWIIGLNAKIVYFENEEFHPIKELNAFLEKTINKAQVFSAYVDEQEELHLGFSAFYPYLISYSLLKNVITEKTEVNPHSLLIERGERTNFVYGVFGAGPANANPLTNLHLNIEKRNQNRVLMDLKYPTRPSRVNYLNLSTNSFLITLDKKLFLLIGGTIHNVLECKTNILFLFKDHKNRIWILPENDGAYLLDAANLFNGKIRHLFKGHSFSSMIEDTETNYWLSSLKGGIYQVPGFDIIHYQVKENDNNIRINTVAKYHNGIYAGGLSKDIYTLDKESQLKKSFELPYKSMEVLDMKEEKNCLLIGGVKCYIATIEPVKVRVKEIHSFENIVPGNTNANYFNAGVTSKKILAGASKGISDLNLNTLRSDCHYPLPPSGPNGVYTDTISKEVYIACLNGLYYTADNFHSYSKVKDSLLNTRINYITKKDSLFILSSKERGLIFWNGKKAWNLTKNDGLASDECKKALVDNNGNIWVATNKGISKVEKKTGGKFEINNITSYNGLLSDDVYNLSIIDTDIWVPTTSGATRFSTNTPIKNNTPPPVYITNITVDDSIYKVNSFSEIPYQHNYIKINYNGLSYKSTTDLMYEYRLTGLDTNWKTTKSTQAEFTKLAAGEYLFEVKAIKNKHIKSSLAAAFRFIIYPPWYKTWWFIFLSIVSTVAVMYLFFWIRFKRLKTREEEKTKLITLVTETEIKALRAQTNPHFIFNALNSISLFVLKNDSDQAQFYLMRFAQLMRDVLENSEHDVINLGKEFSILKTYMELEVLRFGGKYRFEITIPEDLLNAKIPIPPLLLQPIIENAIWHGLMPLEEREGLIELKARKNENSVIITVEDNGVGRKKSAEIKVGKFSHKTSKGIFMTKNRIDLFNKKHKEKINILTTDLMDANLMATGTRVEITIENI